MAIVTKTDKITVDEYLQGELSSEVKHELIDGFIYAMTGASKNHNRIARNLYRKIANNLEGAPCEPFNSDLKVQVADNFYYPDLSVVCEDSSDNQYYTTSPVIIVEVLSQSTRKTDQTIKKNDYLALNSLQEYVLIEQDFVDVEVFSKSDDWRSSHYFLGDEILFKSIDCTVAVTEIYDRVINDDMTEYLAKKQEAQSNSGQSE